MLDPVDYGKQPYVINTSELAMKTSAFRTAIWTGDNLQMTIMSIPTKDNIGMEVHGDHDQILTVIHGDAYVEMGPGQEEITFTHTAKDGETIFVPAGVWHNVTNIGDKLLKVSSVYAPSEHPFGTIHETKADAVGDES